MTDESLLQNTETVKRLALSESGFVFDPSRGVSFSVNPTGLFLLRQLQNTQDRAEITAAAVKEWNVSRRDAERDLLEFAERLRQLLK